MKLKNKITNMSDTEKFEDFLDKMQGLLDNAKKQGHIIVRTEDLENTFSELHEPKDKDKPNGPNGAIVYEDFNEGDGLYKVNLNYLNKEQVEEIEGLVEKWNPESEDEKIRKWIITQLQFKIGDNVTLDNMICKAIDWLEKQGETNNQK